MEAFDAPFAKKKRRRRNAPLIASSKLFAWLNNHESLPSEHDDWN
jgi:hypothetical protein